jgi:VanZ family protein
MRWISALRTAAPWLVAALIVFWTLGPVTDRPYVGHAQLERFAAYCLLSFLLALAYPKRRLWVALAVMLAAALLEFAQLFAPGRDARVIDAMAKMAGAATGVLLASAAARLAKRAAT